MIEQEYLWNVHNTCLKVITFLSCRVYSEGTDGGWAADGQRQGVQSVPQAVEDGRQCVQWPPIQGN